MWGRGEVHAQFIWGNLGERGHLKDLVVGGRKVYN